jgi:hypothetical protein
MCQVLSPLIEGDSLILHSNVFRWDAIPNETLPEYMKALYSVIYHTSNEVAEHALKKHGCSIHYHLQKSVNYPQIKPPLFVID